MIPHSSHASSKLLLLGTLTLLFFLVPHQAQAAWCDTGYSNRKEVTISNSNVDEDLTDFPLWIAYDSDITSTAQLDGDDIFFTAEDACATNDPGSFTKLAHDFVDADSDITTGSPGAFVKIPTVSSSASTVIHVYYGNASAASDEDEDNTWHANFVGVYHLEESSGDRGDSSGNGNTLTDTNTVTTETGKLGTAASFTAANSEYLTRNTALATAAPLSFCAWFNPNGTGVYGGIVYIGDKDVNNTHHWRLVGVNSIRFVAHDGTNDEATDGNFTVGSWNHTCGVEIASNSRAVYLNGGSKATGTTNVTPDNADSTTVGAARDTATAAEVWPE